MVPITKENLEQLLVGKQVQVTHPGTEVLGTHSGVVTEIINTKGEPHFDVSFDGYRFGFIPVTLAEECVEGFFKSLLGDPKRRFTVQRKED